MTLLIITFLREKSRKWCKQIYGKAMKLRDYRILAILGNRDTKNSFLNNMTLNGLLTTPNTADRKVC